MQQNMYLQLKNTLYAAVFADEAWYAVSEYQAAVGSFDRRCLAFYCRPNPSLAM